MASHGLLAQKRKSRRTLTFVFYIGTIAGSFLLTLETILWLKYGGTAECGAGLTYVICSRDDAIFVFAQIPNKVSWFTMYSWIYVSPWAIASLALLTGVLLSLALLTPIKGFIVALTAYGLGILGWGTALANYHQITPFQLLTWLLPFETMIKSGFLGQDLDQILFFIIVVLAAFRCFNVGISTMVSSASLAALPLSIYFLDRGEFDLHVEGQFSSLYFITNAYLLQLCAYAFLVGVGITAVILIGQRRSGTLRGRLSEVVFS